MPPARRRSRASTATRWSRGCARAAIATSLALSTPGRSRAAIADAGAARRFRRLPRRRLDHQWANALPGELETLRPAKTRSARMMAASRCSAPLSSTACRRCAAGSPRTRRSRSVTWFRVGGPAEVMFRPADRRRPRRVPRGAARGRAGDGDRRRLEPAGARRRRAGRRGAARPRLRRDRDRRRATSTPAPARSTSTSR